MHFLKSLGSVCSQMAAHISLHAPWFAFLHGPGSSEEPCGGAILCLDLSDPPLGVLQAVKPLPVHQGLCTGPFPWLSEATDGSTQHLALPCALSPSAKCTGRPRVCLFCLDGWFPEVQLLRRAQQPALPVLMWGLSWLESSASMCWSLLKPWEFHLVPELEPNSFCHLSLSAGKCWPSSLQMKFSPHYTQDVCL